MKVSMASVMVFNVLVEYSVFFYVFQRCVV